MNQRENNGEHQPESEGAMTFDMMMDGIRPIINEQNTYPFKRCIHRNLLLLGRTRTGKSTISEVISDPACVAKDAKLFSETRKITLNRVAANHREQTCYFNIIDSPGLYDNTIEQKEHLTNEKIRQYINECITKDVTDIHAFGFVFSANGGINSEDIKSMIFVKEKYPELKNSIEKEKKRVDS
ncbi:unnamed protein product [Adineta ricciae]|uniref:AIG1-type G domain-containing protein n=1 Tax=Adineta ricciae TaxID=249248 RepID=A0A815WQ33_ADIRI|nr:unnamed protein product [Adineta ricciae]CAF1642778.1 unnamed protein product [Adineta ricciae]